MENLLIERLGLAGDGIARSDSMDIYVPFSLPGETVTGTIAENRLHDTQVSRASPDRIRPVCNNFGTCGGCSLQHASDDFLTTWKRVIVEKALAARGLSAPIRAVHTSPPKSRRRAALSGRRTKKTTIVGFHKRASEDITPLSACHLVHPEITASVPVLGELTRLGASRSGQVRLLVTHFDAGLDVAVSEAKSANGPMLAQLAGLAVKHDLARLSWNGDVVVANCVPQLNLGKSVVSPPPGAFLQATPEGEAALCAAVARAIAPAGCVADLFAGCGTFSLPSATHAEVHAVEEDAGMLAALDEAWRTAPGLKPLTCEARDLFRRPLLAAELNRFDAIIIDPPRAGAEAQSRELAASEIARIAAVSCNPVTFARDAQILCEAGFQIDWIEVVDQFRWSGHVELVAQFSR